MFNTGVASTYRSFLIATRASAETKERFCSLAASQSMTESALLMRLVQFVLDEHSGDAPATAREHDGDRRRVSLRLRAIDAQLLQQRANDRGLKFATYVGLLVRTHLHRHAPLPMQELNELKLAVSRLSGAERQLQRLLPSDAFSGPDVAGIRSALGETLAAVKDLRRAVAEVVKANLMSWETNDV
jgi:hypothetical protein